MDAEKIIQDLNRRFAAPLPEFYKRRVIFWYDEDKEFEDQIDEISLNDAKIVKITGSNSFAIKKLLVMDDTASNYLVYCPVSFEHPENNWLLKLYSGEPFRADLNTIWMDEMGLPASQMLRKQVKQYHNSLILRNAAQKWRRWQEILTHRHRCIWRSLFHFYPPSVILL